MSGLLFAVMAAGAIARLGDSSLSVAQRNDACVALRGDTSAAAIQAMRNALVEPVVRACAARNLREAAAVVELRSALAEEDAEVRAAAARELGALHDAEAVPLLARNSRDPNLLVAVAAIHALGEIGGRASLDELLWVARAGGFVGLRALAAAAGCGDVAVLPVARQYMAGADVPARVLAIGIIGRLGSPEDLPALREIAATSERVQAHGRGFGFMPPIDLAAAARHAIKEISGRK